MNKALLPLVCVLGSVLLSSCENRPDTTSTPDPHLTTNGTMEVAGRPITVIEKDNSSDPETGVSQARELIEAELARERLRSLGITIR